MTVNIKFLSNLEYQLKAIKSVTELFEGIIAKESAHKTFGINPNPNIISLDLLNKNLEKIQRENSIAVSKIKSLTGKDLYDRPNFNIEMETGTGKTYIFLRTILELSQRFGLQKFIIVVPSVAIRESVLANLRLTREHFKKLYERKAYEYRVFSSDKLTDLGVFCRSSLLEIMVITIQSFNKQDINKLYERGRDDVFIAESGIDMLAQTQPVLVLDEPHKMSSELSVSALNNLNPLFILRYSATHLDYDKSHLIYRLTPLDAHNLGLVKTIDVVGTVMKNEISLPLVKLINVALMPKIRAKVAAKVRTAKGVEEKIIILSKSDSLHEKTRNPAYKNLIVTNISGDPNDTFIELSNHIKINLNDAIGDTYLETAREQIRETILIHFEKQKKLKLKNVKVLSLFFVDEVSDYQEIDPTKTSGVEELSKTNPEKYLFVRNTFDLLFNELKQNYPDWITYEPEMVRGAYFSPKKTFKSIAQDKDKIKEILQDKERLISFESPTSFIFTHSALGEGWDNPNIFNICTLRLSHSDITKRQTIGRGLRIPISQSGERYEESSENVLTVIANESYEDFARGLQLDYENDGFIKKPPVENRQNKVTSKIREPVFNGEFREIWNKLKIKTTFKSRINTEKLIEECKVAIEDNLIVKKPIIDIRRATLHFTTDGLETFETESEPIKYSEIKYVVPDIITRMASETGLTRKTVSEILLKSNRIKDVLDNPEQFTSGSIKIINAKKIKMEIESAEYQTGGGEYSEDIFEKEVSSYKEHVIEANNSVYDKVICDVKSEEIFAKGLKEDGQVNVFCKLPQRYYIETPRGRYRPDWAIIYQRTLVGGMQMPKIHLVCETKFGYSEIAETIGSVPPEELDKVNCALRHFRAVGGISFSMASSYDEFKSNLPN
jgi:type III restriction enzyme